MSWQDYVTACQQLGFTKVTIVNRESYQTLASSADTDIATAWMEGDAMINENQELLDDWKDKKKAQFCFYGSKFQIIQRDEDDGNWIVCTKGKEVCIAHQFKSVWFVVYGQVKPKGTQDAQNAAGFKGAPDAMNQVFKNVWDALIENGI